MAEIKETLILNQLIINPNFRLRTLPYLQENYFSNQYYKLLFNIIKDYIEKYHYAPSQEALLICLKPKTQHYTEEQLQNLSEIIEGSLFESKDFPLPWLIDVTEEFCQEKAIYNSLLKSIEIHQGIDKTASKQVIPELLKEALSISFDTKVGQDYLDDFQDRYQFYSTKESGIPFDIPILNQITNDVGIPRKAITILISSTGGGKSLSKCHFAAAALKQGFNVLYFTMEMAAERIGQRIDANLMDIPHNNIPLLSEKEYHQKMSRVKQLAKGKLFIKEFPTGSATSGHFRHVLEELKRKKNIKIDLMIVDYLNICASSRYKNLNGINSYTLLKAVTEELRGLGMEYDMAVLSSSQVNRANLDNQDMGLDALSESMGIGHTADIIWSLFRNDQLDTMDRILITQLKNRYDDLSRQKRFLLGINRSKMQLFEVQFNEIQGYLGKSESEDLGPTEITSSHFKGRGGVVEKSKNFNDFKF